MTGTTRRAPLPRPAPAPLSVVHIASLPGHHVVALPHSAGVLACAGRSAEAFPVPTSSLSPTPRTPKDSAERGRGETTPKSKGKRSSGDRTSARREGKEGGRRSASPGDKPTEADATASARPASRRAPPDAQGGDSSARPRGSPRGSLFQDAERNRLSARARDEATEFTTDGVDEASLSFEKLVDRCRRLKASDARNHGEVRRLQRELHAFVSFPFDVTEERRNDARAMFEKVPP